MTALAPRYTAELAERIVHELANRRTLLDICGDPGMPSYSSLMLWVANDHEGFKARCDQARAIGGAPLGPPTRYTAELAERIVGALLGGRTLVDLCSDPGMPPIGTVKQWISDNREDFTARYKTAQEIGRAVSGRGVHYSEAVADRILGELTEGRTIVAVCKDPGMPSVGTVLRWVREDREGFKARYREARDIGNQVLMDEIIEVGRDSSKDLIKWVGKDGEIETVVDHDHINRARLHSDNLKWTLSRIMRKTYGDRLDVNAIHHAGDGWAELLKFVNNKSRGLPNQYPLPGDDGNDDT